MCSRFSEGYPQCQPAAATKFRIDLGTHSQDEEEEEEEERGSNRELQRKDVLTKVLVVDGCLRFRVDQHLLAELAVLRLRIAAAFAAKVRLSDPCRL